MRAGTAYAPTTTSWMGMPKRGPLRQPTTLSTRWMCGTRRRPGNEAELNLRSSQWLGYAMTGPTAPPRFMPFSPRQQTDPPGTCVPPTRVAGTTGNRHTLSDGVDGKIMKGKIMSDGPTHLVAAGARQTIRLTTHPGNLSFSSVPTPGTVSDSGWPATLDAEKPRRHHPLSPNLHHFALHDLAIQARISMNPIEPHLTGTCHLL